MMHNGSILLINNFIDFLKHFRKKYDDAGTDVPSRSTEGSVKHLQFENNGLYFSKKVFPLKFKIR